MSVQGEISDYYLPCPALTYDCGHKLPLGKSNGVRLSCGGLNGDQVPLATHAGSLADARRDHGTAVHGKGSLRPQICCLTHKLSGRFAVTKRRQNGRLERLVGPNDLGLLDYPWLDQSVNSIATLDLKIAHLRADLYAVRKQRVWTRTFLGHSAF